MCDYNESHKHFQMLPAPLSNILQSFRHCFTDFCNNPWNKWWKNSEHVEELFLLPILVQIYVSNNIICLVTIIKICFYFFNYQPNFFKNIKILITHYLLRLWKTWLTATYSRDLYWKPFLIINFCLQRWHFLFNY